MEGLIVVVLSVIAVLIISFVVAGFRRLSRWNQTYVRLGARYGGGKSRNGGVVYGFLLNNPSLTFDYGRTLCSMRNRKSFRSSTGRVTEISMNWPNRKLKLEISTSVSRSRQWGPGAMNPVEIENPTFQSAFYVSSNSPLLVQRLLNGSVQWQIEMLRRHMGNNELFVSILRGNLVVSKPGYIKQHQQLEDFLRLALELFDQFMLVNAEGIEFLHEDEASVVANVKCPICSEEIKNDMVVCSRCKTPHCQDCWHYNGQCATFACSETRYIQSGTVSSS